MAWWQRQNSGSTRGKLVALLRRGERSVEELAQALGITDNAVRAQLVSLERDGVVASRGIRRGGTVGKPATMYGLAEGTAPMLSAAYAPLLAALLAELGARLTGRQLDAALRAAGRRLARAPRDDTSFAKRVEAGAAMLLGLGADADLVKTAEGYEIVGHGCVLADAVTACPESCRAVESMLTETVGARVRERCDRNGPPSCRFIIAAPA